MSLKIARIDIRLDEKTKILVRETAKALGFTESEYILNSIYSSLKKDKDKLPFLAKKTFKEEQRKRDLDAYRIIRKDYNRMNYIIRNVYVAVYKLSTSFMINNRGNINMGIIKKTVNNYLNEIKKYPNSVKRELKTEIEGLQELKNEKILKEKLGIYKRITTEQKRVGYDEK